jgi:hypothetical protein
MEKDIWKIYENKQVKLIVFDIPYPKKREGIFISHNDTHIFLKTKEKKTPISFLISLIKRIEVMEDNYGY